MDEPNVQIQISAASDSNSEESARNESIPLPLDKRICLVGSAKEDPVTCRAAQEFGIPILTSDTGIEYVNDVSCTTIFILDDFEGSNLKELQKSPHRILGSMALQQLAEKKEKLPQNTRPLYNLAMTGVVVCFTGFRKKEDLTRLIPLIHHMGGSIRKDMVAKVTHLIANCCGGDKYQYATTFKVPVMSQEWVTTCWEQRKDLNLCATMDSLISVYKLKPFYGARVCFYGFSNDETKHMYEVLELNGGVIAKLDDPLCTHVVVEKGETYNVLSPCTNPKSSPPVSTPQLHKFFSPKGKLNSSETFPRTSSPHTSEQTEHPLRIQSKICDNETIKPEKIENSLDKIETEYKKINTEQMSDIMKLSPDLLETIHESPQKRRRDSPPDSSEFEFSFKRQRHSSFVGFETPCKRKFKDILKTPVNFFNRRRSVAVATVTSTVSSDKKNCLDFDQKSLDSSIDTVEFMEHNVICSNLNETFDSLRTNVSSTPVQINNNKEEISTDKKDPKVPVNIFATPKNKSFFKKGFRKSFMSDKSALKNITEFDQNCSIDDCDVSVCGSVKSNPGFLQTEECTPSSYVPILDDCDAAGPDSCGLSTSSVRVVDESSVTERPDGQPKALLVKAEWFWASVQNVACADEKEYLFDDYLECVVSPGRRDSHAATPSSSSRRKRKRLHETLSSLVRNDSPAIHKRRSSVSDAGLLSVSGSFLDCTTSPDKGILDQAEAAQSETPRKNLSPRQQVFLELIQTESNYVNILHTIMTMFKSHLENMPESEALLNNTELKIIFGNLPPIYETHSKMLEELRWASSHWSEDTSVGNILLKYSNDLLKAYPPFVNFFETMKEMLLLCDQSKPRFHAFLKVCQTRPECGRQSLQDLLIRPVQRLPSISLLLNDILKHTSKSNPDHSALEKALSAIKEVMTHINEDKRKTEGQRVMFDIFNEIDNCPPDLVSSHRSFITRCEVTELSDGLSGRGNPLVLFLFTDQLEVCKKRSKAFNTLKSPNTVNGFHSKASTKPYKHVCMMALNTIKRVIDIRETEDCQKVFALVTRDHQELKEKLFSFTMTEEEVDKSTFLKTLCRHIANTAYSADAEKFLAYLEPQQLDIDTSDVTMGTLSKAFKFATRTRIKVGRAFSFNKTPSKLKRAMSTMMSPFGSSTNITPASQLANMRLASYNNINELGNTDSGNETPGSGEALVAPMSVQPTRKMKCSSLSVTALKRL